MSRKISVVLVAVALVSFVGMTAYAGCGSCGADKAADKGKCSKACMEGLDLTADQKAQVEKLVDECSKVGCDKTSAKKMMEGLKGILSDEQIAKMKENCTDEKCWSKEDKGESASLTETDMLLACGSSCGDGDKKKDGEKTDA